MTDSAGRDGNNPFLALRRLARDATTDPEERCDLCGEGLPGQHRHLLDLMSREMLCACRACSILFDTAGAGSHARRLIPVRYRALDGFELTDAQWEGLRIPVNMAFFTYNTLAGRVLALYPSPMGPTESLLSLETWQELEARNPVLLEMEQDVEALLVNRLHGAREYFLLPIDECYRLVGIIRTHWRGLTGGQEVWQEIDRYMAGLRRRAGARAAHA